MRAETFLAAAVRQKALTIHRIALNARCSCPPSDKSWKVTYNKVVKQLQYIREQQGNIRDFILHDAFGLG